jgi:hypothetical protein
MDDVAGERLEALRRLAALLDNRFVIPGTDIRFGLDPVLSLVPGVGDLVSPAFAVLLLVQGVQQRIPKVVMVRMLVNALADALIGAVPVAGNIGDIFWRANTRNLALLERHARPGAAPSTGDYVVVGLLAAAFGAVIFIPVFIGIWLAAALWLWLMS